MPSLRELQQGFAAALFGAPGVAPPFAITGGPIDAAARLAIYRNSVFGNYHGALGASYPVLRQLLGAAEFAAAVDAFVRMHPSASGDLNSYGDAFGDFLAVHVIDADRPWLPDIARLEWAIDEAHRAADSIHAPDAMLTALATIAPEQLPALRFRLNPSCRLLASRFPILRFWLQSQPGHEPDAAVTAAAGAQGLLVRRNSEGVPIERLPRGDFAWLVALAAGATLNEAMEAAQSVDPEFDFGAALRRHIATGTIAAIQ